MALKRSVVAARPMRQLAAPRVVNADASVQRALDSLSQELSPVVSSPVLQGRGIDVELAAATNMVEHGLGRVASMVLITPIDATTAADFAWLRDESDDKLIAVQSSATATVRLWVF